MKKRAKKRSIGGRLRRAAARIRASCGPTTRRQFVAAHGLPTDLRSAQDEIMRLRGVINDLGETYSQRVTALERAHEVLRVAGHQVIESLNTLAKRLETRP